MSILRVRVRPPTPLPRGCEIDCRRQIGHPGECHVVPLVRCGRRMARFGWPCARLAGHGLACRSEYAMSNQRDNKVLVARVRRGTN